MIYSFDDIEIDTACFEVRQRGQTLVVEPKVLDLLVCLVENRHRVVTKAELLDSVWGGRSVVASVLARAVCLARKVVGEHRIQTRYARGYRFIDDPTAEPNDNLVSS